MADYKARRYETKRITIDIKGKVFGYQGEGESERDAICRILLEAELHGNNGASRLHLEPSGTLPVDPALQPDTHDRVVEVYERIGGEEKDRCPYCQAKINFDGSYWPTTSGNFCDKDHYNKWQDAQSQEESFGPQT